MADEKPRAEPLLARWSRLKREAATTVEPPPAGEVAPATEAEPVALPPVESLTPESDFAPFMQRHVRPELQQAALRKLFADPHFNVMDGLDVYIDDYTKPDPIAAAMVSELAQFRSLDGLPRETTTDDAQRAEAAADSVCAPATEKPSATRENALPEPRGTVPGDTSPALITPDTKSRAEQPIDQFVPPGPD